MKISGKLYNDLESYLNTVVKDTVYNSFAEVGEYYNEQKIGKNHNMRARWDLFHGIRHVNPTFLDEWLDVVYNTLGANDDHIDTALRKITGLK